MKWVELEEEVGCSVNEQGEVRGRKVYVHSTGYYYVQKGGKNYYVHRLVATAFIENLGNKPVVNHKDGDKLNNCVSNLEWVTYAENNQHARENGLNAAYRGESSPLSKLTEVQVKEIKKRIAKGDKQREIAEDFNVDKTLISHIKAGRRWAHA